MQSVVGSCLTQVSVALSLCPYICPNPFHSLQSAVVSVASTPGFTLARPISVVEAAAASSAARFGRHNSSAYGVGIQCT